MSTKPSSHEGKYESKGVTLTQDTWAVILALALALAVRISLFKVPW